MSSADVISRLAYMAQQFIETANSISTYLTSYVFDVEEIGNALNLDLSWIPQEWFSLTWGGALFANGIFFIITLTIIQWTVRFSPL